MSELFEALLALLAYGGAYVFHRTGKVPWAFATHRRDGLRRGREGRVPDAAARRWRRVMLWELRHRRAVAVRAVVAGLVAVGVARRCPTSSYSDARVVHPLRRRALPDRLVPTAREPWIGGQRGHRLLPGRGDRRRDPRQRGERQALRPLRVGRLLLRRPLHRRADHGAARAAAARWRCS